MMRKLQFDFRLSLSSTLLLALSLLGSSDRPASAQALPAAEAAPVSTGFALPTTLGSLQYAVTASQSLAWGNYTKSGVSAYGNISGDVAYLSNSQLHPFSAVLSGGRSFSESSQGSPSYSFASLGLSQVANFGKWNFVITDSLSYLPETPVSGLSGIPGIGDLGLAPVQVGVGAGQGLLTNYANHISNSVAATLSRQITSKTSLNASGSYGIYRTLDTSNSSPNPFSSALDNDYASGSGGISHVVNARTTYGAEYSYTAFTYPNDLYGSLTPNFDSQTASGFVSHKFTPRLDTNISIGPQWTKLGTPGSSSSLGLFVSASSSYTARRYTSSLAFSRSTNSGYGAVGGSVASSANFSINRTFAVVWNVSGTLGYTHSDSLPGSVLSGFVGNTYIAGAQVSRAIVRNLSCFGSYTLERQSTTASTVANVYSGTSQILGFGITYSPSVIHPGRK